MNIKEKNYWLDTVAEPATGATDALPDKVDVAVVGGGFCGLSAARVLAQRGVRLALFEAESLGWGASCRNGGMVLTGMKLPVPTLIKRYGREAVQRMYAASLESIDLVERIVNEEGIDCNFSRCGHLEVACKQAHFDDYAAAAARIKSEFDHELRIIPKNALQSEIGSGIYYGGMVDETSAGLNPARYVAGLGATAIRAGAQVAEHTTLQRIERDSSNGGPGFRLTTSRGKLRARNILVATSGYTRA